MDNFLKGLFSGKPGDKKVKITLVVGIVGILLIFLSGNLAGAAKPAADANAAAAGDDEYKLKFEENLRAIVAGIDGVGAIQLMVTFESDSTAVYAEDGKSTTDVVTGEQGGTERATTERNIILVDGQNGRSALQKTTLAPAVRGVVVVCEGGDQPVVVERVVGAVRAACNISSSRIYVGKLKISS